jgi:hypothetical protein
MLKNILKLEGAQKLNKNEQKEINGGLRPGCRSDKECPIPPVGAIYLCVNGVCQLWQVE